MLRAPFPYMGGKSRAAALIWQRLGDVENYVEPFFGSGAVLLARPSEPKIETVNDIDGLLTNAWRGIQLQPRLTAEYADGPVSELDLHARHAWLVSQRVRITRMLRQDPAWCDPKAAGWWIWGLSCWIGSGWCDGRAVGQKRPMLTPNGGGHGHGRGVHADRLREQLPRLAYQAPGSGVVYGQGVHSQRPQLSQKLPSIGFDGGGKFCGRGVQQATGIYAWFDALSERLRRVRVTSGDWTRVMGDSVLLGNGVTGVMLDPPYAGHLRVKNLYACDSNTISDDVRRWAIEHGDDPRLRIALCGYEAEHGPHMPPGWECVAWKANGGYGNASGNQNKHEERIWFSPHCLRGAEQLDLLGRSG